jgi:hypothetical protein
MAWWWSNDRNLLPLCWIIKYCCAWLKTDIFIVVFKLHNTRGCTLQKKKLSQERLVWISMKFESQHLMLTLIPGIRISSVSSVTKQGTGNRGIVMWVPAGVTEFYVLRNAQPGCAAHPAPVQWVPGKRGSISGVKRPEREVVYLSSSLGNRTSCLMLISLMLHNIRLFVNCISTDQCDGTAAVWTPEVLWFDSQYRQDKTGSGAHPATSAVGTVVLPRE